MSIIMIFIALYFKSNTSVDPSADKSRYIDLNDITYKYLMRRQGMLLMQKLHPKYSRVL